MVVMPEILLYSLLHDIRKAKRILYRSEGGRELIASLENTISHIELTSFTKGLETEQQFFDSLLLMDGETGELMKIKVPVTREKPYEVVREE